MKQEAAAFFRRTQATICEALEALEPSARFESDTWERTDSGGGHGGGGLTRVLRGGSVFEQGGVSFSEVHGTLPADMCERLVGERRELPFFATGVSLVIHPVSPLAPTTHANYRYLEVDSLAWFGGGGDLTPYYLFTDDAVHFHRTLKQVCDEHDRSYYPRFKKECDEYFFLPHRGETRGVGGIFFDYLGRDGKTPLPQAFAFVKDLAASFPSSYVPIVERRSRERWTEPQKKFQLLRRGRYVEFNLLYDRGTLFGLRTGGRTESILMSLPPSVSWEYNFQAAPGSPEAALIETLRSPRDWVPA